MIMKMGEKLYDRLYLFVVCVTPLLITVCDLYGPLTICVPFIYGEHTHKTEEPKENIRDK
jgi:hypothetical protein